MLHIASRKSDAHCMAAWERRKLQTGFASKYGRAVHGRLGRIESGVGGNARKVEHGGAETGILEVDQPEPVAIVNELAGNRSWCPNMTGSGSCTASSLVCQFDVAAPGPPCGCCPPPAYDHSRG
jgi:hypothetical protein